VGTFIQIDMAMIFLMCSYLLQVFSSPVGVPVVEKKPDGKRWVVLFQIMGMASKKTNELSNILFDSSLI
jgi:hypothetical protein